MTIVNEKRDAVTLDEARADIARLGYRVSDGGSFETDTCVYASSRETLGIDAYSHPAASACWHKPTGFYTVIV